MNDRAAPRVTAQLGYGVGRPFPRTASPTPWPARKTVQRGNGPRFSRLRWYVPFLLVPIPVLILLGLQVQDTLDEPASTDGSCLAGSEVAEQAVFLIDLRKPVDPAYESLPGDLLGEVSKDLPANTDLSVYALSAYAEAPRTLLGRLCKPYDNGDIVVESAKDQRDLARDCDNLPAQISGSLRTSATRYCEQRHALRRRIDALAEEVQGRVATDAYLVEALEETRRDFANSPVPTALYLFSDMMQHADWYSHVDLQRDDWDFEDFVSAQKARTLTTDALASHADTLPVTVFYVAREGVTDSQQPQLRHRQFWETYFGGADLDFIVQPTMAGYAAEPLMDVPTPAELAAYELERARYTSELVERERAELERTRRSLETARAQFAQREQKLEEEQRRLALRQQELAAQKREIEARAGDRSRDLPADRVGSQQGA